MMQTIDIYYPNGSPENLFIRFIWKSIQTDCNDEKETILPKGTAEIIFNLNDDIFYSRFNEENLFKMPQCIINGINTTPYSLLKHKNQSFIGIQLNAFALKYLFNIPAIYFTNHVLDGFDICTSLKVLFEKLASNNSFNVQVSNILSWLNLTLSTSQNRNYHKLILGLLNSTANDTLSIKILLTQCNFSDRHLRRLSNLFLGMNPEEYILYRMYLKSLTAIHDLSKSLTSIAYDCGFYDQSHFIRCFKTFTGLTPGEYRKQMSELPGHIYKDQSSMSG